MPAKADSEQELVAALTYKNGDPVHAITEEEKHSVTTLYDRYDEKLGCPCPELHATELSQNLSEAVYAGYGEVRDGGRLQNLRSRLMLAAPRCPYCGFGAITDLDHHLPRSTYKCLAIYSRNLVPVCHTCNNKKRAVAGADANNQFLHAYFEDLPEEEFLRAIVEAGAQGFRVRFEVFQCQGLSDDAYQRISFQVTRLELNRRYAAEVNDYLGSLETSFEDAFSADQNGAKVKDFLLRSAESVKSRFGLNHWKTALLKGLADCAAFCNGGFKQALGHSNPGA